jgi:hypothetical protein
MPRTLSCNEADAATHARMLAFLTEAGCLCALLVFLTDVAVSKTVEAPTVKFRLSSAIAVVSIVEDVRMQRSTLRYTAMRNYHLWIVDSFPSAVANIALAINR